MVLGMFEIIGLLVILRIWMRRRHRRIVTRLLWSVLLLVPVFGLLMYFVLRQNPEEHPYDTDTMRESAESIESGGDHS